MNAIMAERSAANRLKDAALLLRQFDAAEDQRVKKSASHMQEICETLAATLLADVWVWEKLARAKSADEISALVPESAKSASDMDEAWRLVPLGVAAVTHALVDPDRLTNGKTLHLRLTRAERAKLNVEIKTFFPNLDPKAKGGHAVDVSVNLFRGFLNRAWS